MKLHPPDKLKAWPDLEFSKLNQNRACSDLQKVTQLYWIFVSIPLPKIKWVTIQGRFRSLPVYSWQLWVSVWKQRVQGMNFPSLNIDALHTGSRGACSKPVSCHQHSAAQVSRSKCGRTLLAPPQCTRVHFEAHREGEGSGVKSQPCSGHILHSTKTPRHLSCQENHKPGFTFLTFHHSQPNSNEAFYSQTYFSLTWSMN